MSNGLIWWVLHKFPSFTKCVFFSEHVTVSFNFPNDCSVLSFISIFWFYQRFSLNYGTLKLKFNKQNLLRKFGKTKDFDPISTHREIAKEMGISVKTIESYRNDISMETLHKGKETEKNSQSSSVNPSKVKAGKSDKIKNYTILNTKLKVFLVKNCLIKLLIVTNWQTLDRQLEPTQKHGQIEN